MEITTMPKEDMLAVIREKATGMISQVRAFEVDSQETLQAASDMIARVKKLAKLIDVEKEKFVLPAKSIIATAKEKYDPYIAKCKDAEVLLKSKASVFMIAERKREEAEKAKIEKKVESG